MYQNEYVLLVDIKKPLTSVVPMFVQFDNATLVFKVFDNGKPFSLVNFTKAEVVHKRPDGAVVVGQGTIETLNGDQVIRYHYLGSEMRSSGWVSTSLSIYSDTKKVSIHPFNVRIIQDIKESIAEEAKKDFGLMQELIAQTEEMFKEVETTLDDANNVLTQATERLNEITGYTEIANEAAQNANNKAALAEQASISANEKALFAEQKANLANEKALLAEQAAKNANEVITDLDDLTVQATTAITNANNAATNVTTLSEEVDTVLTNVQTTLTEINTVKSDVETLSVNVETEITSLTTLKNETDIAKNNAVTATENANLATSAANEKALLAEQKANLANEKSLLAEQATINANTATENTNNAIEQANNAITTVTNLSVEVNEVKANIETLGENVATELNSLTTLKTETETAKNNAITATTGANEAAHVAQEAALSVGNTLDSMQNIIDNANEVLKQVAWYSYDLTATTEGQTKFSIPLSTFGLETDMLFITQNRTLLSKNDYTATNTEITLNEGVSLNTTISITILKNVPMYGEEVTLSASNLMNGSVGITKLNTELQDLINNKASKDDLAGLGVSSETFPRLSDENDDTKRLQRAINFAEENNLELTLGLNKTYILSDTLYFTDGRINGNNSILSNTTTDKPILMSRILSDKTSKITSDGYIRNLKFEGNIDNSNNHGLLAISFWSKYENLEFMNVGGHAIKLTHLHEDGSNLATGTLVENQFHHIIVRNTGLTSLFFGEGNNNKITDGFLSNCILVTSAENALYVGSGAGWIVQDIHIYNEPQTPILIANSFNTTVHNIYIEQFVNNAIDVPAIQRNLIMSNLNIDASSSVDGSSVIRLDRASFVQREETAVLINNINVSHNGLLTSSVFDVVNPLNIRVSNLLINGLNKDNVQLSRDSFEINVINDISVQGKLSDSVGWDKNLKPYLSYEGRQLKQCNYEMINHSTLEGVTFPLPLLTEYSKIVGNVTIDATTNHNGLPNATWEAKVYISWKGTSDEPSIYIRNLIEPEGFTVLPTVSLNNTDNTLTFSFNLSDQTSYGVLTFDYITCL